MLSRKKSFKQLKTKYWKRVREYVLRRDKYRCQLCGSIVPPFDVDHCFSRAIQLLHFDDRNLTTLCKYCHTRKSYAQQDFIDRVREAVIKREGQRQYDELRRLSKIVGKVNEDMINALLDEYQARWPEPEVYGKCKKKN